MNKTTHCLLITTGIIPVIMSLFSFGIYQFIFLFVSGIITLLYTVPVLPFKSKKRIKDFGILKIVTLALIWTLVTVWFPAGQEANTGSFQLIFAGRFIFIFILCLVFDMRDVGVDSIENIRTIPLIAGRQNAYRIIYFFLILFILISLLQYFSTKNFIQFNAMLISAFATFFVVKISRKQHSDFFYLACIDGMMLLQAMLVIIDSN